MPHVEFSAMPDSARVWVFGATAPLSGAAHEVLMDAVDQHLERWKAHGAPLVCARDWRDDRFLAVAVDEAATGASGCSIDGLFRTLSELEHRLKTSIVDSAAVYWRTVDGHVVSSSRAEFKEAAKTGDVMATTPVFDTTVTTAGAWRDEFERPASESWHARLIAR